MERRHFNRLAAGALVAGALVIGGWSPSGGRPAGAQSGKQPPAGSGEVMYQRPAAVRAPGDGTSPPASVQELQLVGATASAYHPLSPCRLVDTRNLMNGIMQPNVPRVFLVYTSDASDQGGDPVDCGVPSTAVAVHLNVTSAGQPGTGNGNVKVYPFGDPIPTASLVNFKAGIGVANAATVKVCHSGFSLCANDISAVASAQTHLIVDVLGYYEAPLVAQVNYDGTPTGGSPAIVSSAHLGLGAYEVVFDRDVTPCVFMATVGGAGGGSVGGAQVEVADRAGTPEGVFVGVSDSAGTDADYPFHLLVVC